MSVLLRKKRRISEKPVDKLSSDYLKEKRLKLPDSIDECDLSKYSLIATTSEKKFNTLSHLKIIDLTPPKTDGDMDTENNEIEEEVYDFFYLEDERLVLESLSDVSNKADSSVQELINFEATVNGDDQKFLADFVDDDDDKDSLDMYGSDSSDLSL